MQSTICAISTPYGSGGISVIRVSGPEAIACADRLFRGRKPLSEARGGSVHLGTIEREDEVLDQVLATVFRAPHSYTGEDTVELACHGSLYIQQTLLQWLIDVGCSMAGAGEFTERAFLNGQLDLAQAEAVADLIASQSRAEKELAMSQLRGRVSRTIDELRDRLLEFTSLIELELDFADHEELEFADRSQLQLLLTTIDSRLGELCGSFRQGNAIKNGIGVAIVGAPNVGKSTLLNALLGEERAIVSEIQGTTRDTIEDRLLIGGVLFRLTDTAGIRMTDDRLEQLGIERSRRAVDESQIVIEVVDALRPDARVAGLDTQDKVLLQVWNKCDLVAEDVPAESADVLCLSAKSGRVDALRDRLLAVAQSYLKTDSVLISNARHYEALCRAQQAVQRVQQGMNDGLSGELLSMDLQDALSAMGEVTGCITSQEVLNNIFAHFCIGK